MKLKYLVAASPFLREISNLSIPNIKDSYKFGLFLNKVDPYLKVYSDSYGKLVKRGKVLEVISMSGFTSARQVGHIPT